MLVQNMTARAACARSYACAVCARLLACAACVWGARTLTCMCGVRAFAYIWLRPRARTHVQLVCGGARAHMHVRRARAHTSPLFPRPPLSNANRCHDRARALATAREEKETD